MAAREDPYLANLLATRLENELLRSATVLRWLAEGIVALDIDGIVVYANPRAEALLGYEPGTLLGLDFHEATRHRKRDGTAVPRAACGILTVLTEEEEVRVDDHDVFERADGGSFFAGFRAARIVYEGHVTGAAVMFEDITDRKAGEQELVLSRAALDAVPAPVFWIAADASIIYANAAASRHLEIPQSALLRARVTEFDADHSDARWQEHWRRIKAEGRARFPSRHRTASGAIVPVDIAAQHVSVEDREFHVAIVLPPSGGEPAGP